jgi:hypothetical protein
MSNIKKIIKKYSTPFWSIYNGIRNEKQLLSDQSFEFLSKYWLSENEYISKWKIIQDEIFINQNNGLPKFIFNASFDLTTIMGGAIFDKSDFDSLIKCLESTEDKYFVIIENQFGVESETPPIKLKFPVDLSWKDFENGCLISNILCKAPIYDYFVFGDSGLWGKYIANEFEASLDFIGFKREFSEVFRENFVLSKDDQQVIKECLPLHYIERYY